MVAGVVRIPEATTTDDVVNMCSYRQTSVKLAVHWLRGSAVIAEFNIGVY